MRSGAAHDKREQENMLELETLTSHGINCRLAAVEGDIRKPLAAIMSCISTQKAAASTKGGDLGIHQCKHIIKSGSGAVWMYDDA